jgi:hypothetical protein
MKLTVKLQKAPIVEVTFERLSVGEVFEDQGRIYMRTASAFGHEAVCLDDGRVYTWYSQLPVALVEAKMVWRHKAGVIKPTVEVVTEESSEDW